jgi:hypothetical protein
MSADSGTKTGDKDNAYEAELERPVTVDYGETKVTKPQPLPAAAVCFPLIFSAVKYGEKVIAKCLTDWAANWCLCHHVDYTLPQSHGMEGCHNHQRLCW